MSHLQTLFFEWHPYWGKNSEKFQRALPKCEIVDLDAVKNETP